MILDILVLQSHPDMSCQVSIQGHYRSAEVQTRFSRWRLGLPSWISVRNNFSYFFIYKSHRYFLPSFGSVGNSVQEKFNIDFKDGGHLGFPINTILTIFDLPGLKSSGIFGSGEVQNRLRWRPCRSSSISSQIFFGSGGEVQNRFSRWQPWQLSWISDRNNFNYFGSTSCPDTSYQASSQLGFRFRRRSAK